MPLVCMVFVIGVAAVVVTFVVLLRRRGRSGTQPSCGQCGYAVQGLPTFTCPECGSDLRQVGIVTPGQARPLGPVARGLIWTLVLPIPAYVVTVILAVTVLPVRVTKYETLDLAQPASGAYQAVSLRATGSQLRWPSRGTSAPAQLDHLSLTLTRLSGRTAKLHVNLPSLAYEYDKPGDAGSKQGDKLDAEVLADWMGGAGIGTEDEQVQAELAALLGLLRDVQGGSLGAIQSGVFQSVNLSSGSGTSPGALWYVILGFWILVWLIGLWYFGRPRKSRERKTA